MCIRDRYKDDIIVFSGFRDDDLKNDIEQGGGEVVNSVSKKCTMLIVKDLSGGTSKVEKAKKFGVKIIKLDDFLK